MVPLQLSKEATVLPGSRGAPAESGCCRHVWSLNRLNSVVATSLLTR